MSDEEESLIATRKRRSNAGSRLKQLLQAEEIANEGDEDNDVDLLFQEDDDDQEFQVGDKDRFGYQGSDEGEEGEEEEDEEAGSDEESQREGTTSVREEASDGSDNEQGSDVNMDDVFSDSEEESEEEDSDEGERELQKQERAKKRQAQKKARIIPKITAKPKSTTPKKKKITTEPKADTLLSLSRRQSSRKTAVQNKMDLVERLKETEQRRQSLKPVARVEYVEMTQEERLAEAIETEKYNVSTLNKYQEQEIDKKKKQRALQLSRRKKLENIVTYKSCPIFVTPVEEHELERFLMTRDTLRRKRDRRGRKSEKQKKEEEEERKKEEARKQRAAMFIIQPKSPVKSPEALKKLQAEGTSEPHEVDKLELPESSVPPESKENTSEPESKEGVTEIRKVDDENENEDDKKRPLSADSVTKEEHDSKRLKIDENDAPVDSDDEIELVKNKDADIQEEKKAEEEDTEANSEEKEDIEAKAEEKEGVKVEGEGEDRDTPAVPTAEDVSETKEEKSESADDKIEEAIVESQESVTEEKADTAPETDDDKPVDGSQSAVADDSQPMPETADDKETKEVEEDKMDVDTPDPKVKIEGSEEKQVKSVKFADEEEPESKPDETTTVDETKPSVETSAEPSSSREGSVVVAEPIVFEGPPQKVAANFISFEESGKKYTIDEIKAYLLGPQSLLPLQRRSHDVEPILRLRADAITSGDDAKVDASRDLPDFEFLNNFPKFGEYNKIKKEQVVLETREDIKVVLKTQAPTGIHLPNGTKKQCLITGKPAMYFDPKTGLPYGSVEAYKVIKDIHNGVWAWVEFPGGGSYVCSRENPAHAKGVPEGFDV